MCNRKTAAELNKLHSLSTSLLLYLSSVPTQNFCHVYATFNEESGLGDLAGKGQPFLTSQSYLNLGSHDTPTFIGNKRKGKNQDFNLKNVLGSTRIMKKSNIAMSADEKENWLPKNTCLNKWNNILSQSFSSFYMFGSVWVLI